MSEKEDMKNSLVKELVSMLMADNAALSMPEAMALVFNSETYQKIQNEGTRLYYQSPRYVFSYLENELKTGKMG